MRNNNIKKQIKMTNIFKALANFQNEVPPIKKNAKGYGYKFADLNQIVDTIRPILYKNKLGYTQKVQGDYIETILFHWESGETITSNTLIPNDVSLKGQNAFQILGSAITYLKRYSLSAILGIVTDEDVNTVNVKTPPTKPNFTELNFAKAKKANATIELIKKSYNITKEVEQKYLDYVTA